MSAMKCWTCSRTIKEPADAVMTWDGRDHPGILRLAHRGDCFAALDRSDARMAYTVELRHHPKLFKTLAGLNSIRAAL